MPRPNPYAVFRLKKKTAAEGALGVGSALIYTPGTFASTDELVALCEAAGGTYISHLRNEGYRLVEVVDELIEITRRANFFFFLNHLRPPGPTLFPYTTLFRSPGVRGRTSIVTQSLTV